MKWPSSLAPSRACSARSTRPAPTPRRCWIANALRHTPPGTRVRARTSVSNGCAELVVEDNGPGIPPELERRIFERFVRGGRDGGRGSGLGLAIVRAVAESHRGTVTLEQPE